ncbi:hypothetical protein A6P39_038810 [Streptomyces sp. FXJ1.172]|uniref:hypothetical protein n=1 Tax=Streptomyces sp. FXJ1.172 TaxID=710705 RepID=UPI0007D020A0|nr:hypothetical protein [Streptomyces sp. FXJ1.172]WEP00521.1 hypothetical protein A6P39_038810 [Streptomyces sp. FXJ1.172]
MRQTTAAVGEVLAWWAVLVVVNLMFISSVSVLELVVAAGGAALTALAARAVHTASRARLGGTRNWGAAALAWPGAVLADLARLCAVTARVLAGRPAEGSLRTVTLARGTGAAWAGALLSSTPGAYVVDVPGRQDGGNAPRTAVAHFLTADRTRLEDVLTEGRRR